MACTIVLFEPLVAGLQTVLTRFPVRVVLAAQVADAARGAHVHVLGGQAAVEYARRHRDDVDSIVVTDGSSVDGLLMPHTDVRHDDTVNALDECLRFWSAYVSPKRRKRALVFDVGGVLLLGDAHKLVDKVFADRPAERRPYGIPKIYHEHVWQELDRGTLMRDSALEVYEPMHGVSKEDFAYYLDHFIEHMPPLEGGVHILNRAKSEKNFILSNFHKETWLRTSQQLHPEVFSKLIPHVSWMTHHNKPEPAIYEELKQLMAQHGIAPEDALFLDDSSANVTAGWACGINGVVIRPANTGHAQSAHETLRYYGLLD